MKELYIVLYSPSSVQKLLDFLKTVYAVNRPVPVIVKPFGAAAQIGIPEAHKVAYRLGKPLIVLPELADLSYVLRCDAFYYLTEDGKEVDFSQLVGEALNKRVALVMGSGDREPSGKELEGFEVIWLKGVPTGMPCTALTGIIAYEIFKYLKHSVDLAGKV
ncbi:MAG: RecB-family nuclease [Desulfurococcaceae archaeon]